MTPFERLHVVEIAGSAAGAYAAKLFADHGAQVTKVEPPGGDPERRRGESWNGMGSVFAALNTSKRTVVLDLDAPGGGHQLEALCAGADVVIESSAPGPLAPRTAGFELPRLVSVWTSPFGLSGPYAGYRSTPFTDYAAGGQLYLNGEPEREPLGGPGMQSHYATGMHAFIGAMAALHARERTGRGQTVELSHMEVMASLHQFTTVRFTHGGYIQRRIGNRLSNLHPITIYPCKDGYVAVTATQEAQAQGLLLVAGLAHLADDDRFSSGVARFQNADALDQALEPWLMAHTATELMTQGQELRVPIAPVLTPLQLLEDEHLNARGFWRTLGEHPPLRFPGPPFRLSRHEWNATMPPQLGEDRGAEVLREHEPEQVPSPQPVRGELRAGPLEGVRVLDLTMVWAGPLAGRILGDLGADVIRVEASFSRGPRVVPERVVKGNARYPGNEAGARPWNRDGMFNKLNRNKRSLTLQLNTPEGKALFERLVAASDVVLENFSPRVMPQFGLGYERLREVNPGIIYTGMPGFGWSGPWRDFVAYGSTIEPAAGLSSLMGYADSGPYKMGVSWPDPTAGLNAVAGILIALRDREADPQHRGQSLEVAQLEAMIPFVGEEILAAQLRGNDRARLGNRDPEHAPQGCYPCLGEDRWMALTVTGDPEWRTLCKLAGLPEEWAAMDLGKRVANHDLIDSRLARWTLEFDHYALMHQLQAAGIAACAVIDARDMLREPHLAARDFFVELTHPDAGTLPFPGMPVHLSATPATFRRPAPCLGEHNDEVLSQVLGMSDAEIADLQARGVLVDEPPE